MSTFNLDELSWSSIVNELQGDTGKKAKEMAIALIEKRIQHKARVEELERELDRERAEFNRTLTALHHIGKIHKTSPPFNVIDGQTIYRVEDEGVSVHTSLLS